MKALDIIDALTRMGNTEGTGIFTTPDTDMLEWLGEYFGGGCDKMMVSNELKPNTKYLYVYDERLSVNAVENSTIVVKTKYSDSVNTWTERSVIYIYEIE